MKNCGEKYAEEVFVGRIFGPIYPTPESPVPFSKQPEKYRECIYQLTKPTSYPFKNFIEGKSPLLTKSLIKELVLEGICPRPSLLK